MLYYLTLVCFSGVVTCMQSHNIMNYHYSRVTVIGCFQLNSMQIIIYIALQYKVDPLLKCLRTSQTHNYPYAIPFECACNFDDY